jgi:F-type H+-transporting ATPase subunit delta
MAARDDAVVRVYSEALLELAFEKGVHAEVLAELQELERIPRDGRFREFLSSPRIRTSEKKDVIEKVFGGTLSDTTLNFLKLLLDRGRELHLRDIIRAYIDGCHLRMGELVVKAESAVPITSAQREWLRRVVTMRKHKGKDVLLEERLRPALLGGLVLTAGDQRIDGSLRARLNEIGSRLAAVRLRSEEHYED